MDINKTLAVMLKEYDRQVRQNKMINAIAAKIDKKESSYPELRKLTSLSGRIAGDIITKKIEELYEGKRFSEEEVRQLLSPVLRHNYIFIIRYTEKVQSALDEKAGTHLPVIIPDYDVTVESKIITEIVNWSIENETAPGIDVSKSACQIPEETETASFDPWQIHNGYHHTSAVSDEEYLEALEWLSKREGTDGQVGCYNSAAFYFDREEYELALKYFIISVAKGEKYAYFYIGYIYYYGLAGKTNYAKAWDCFMKMARLYTLSTIMVAVMYRDGNYVKQDCSRYRAIIEEMYQNPSRAPLSDPHLYFHMAEIRRKEGHIDEAVDFYKTAKEALDKVLYIKPYIGLLRRMEEIVTHLYALTSIDLQHLDLFDLFYILAKPCIVRFIYDDQEYVIESHTEKTCISVKFEDHWYRSVLQFIKKAELGGQRLLTLRKEMEQIRV